MKPETIEYLVRHVAKGTQIGVGGKIDEDSGARLLSLEEIKVIFLGQIAITLDKLHQHFETVDAVVFGSPQAKGKAKAK